VPADLSALPSLSLGTPQQRHIWHLIGPKLAEARIEHSPRLITCNMNTLRQAAVAGLGVVQMPTMMIRRQMERGELKALIPDWAPRGEVIHAVMPSRRGLLPGVRALLD